MGLKVVGGEGFNDEKYSLFDIDNLEGDLTNHRMFVNKPTRIGKGISNRDFEEIRAIFIDIDPNKDMKAIINGNSKYDWKTWNKKVEKEIDNIIEVFKYNYGKEPSYIYNTGAGIQIILLLDKPKKQKNIKKKDMIHYGFIFKLLQLGLSQEFEMDDAIYNLKESTRASFWTRIAPRKAKTPVKQKVIKYQDEFKKTGIKYRSKIFCIKGNPENTFKLNEMIVKEYEFLSSTIYKWQIDSLPKSRIEAIADISRIFCEGGAKDKGTKVNMISCVFPEHPDRMPSAVFFKDSGTFYCSACNKSLTLQEVYTITTGENISLDDDILLFKDMSKYLIRYSKSDDGNIYHFETIKGKFSIHIDEWKEAELLKILTTNGFTGFKGSLKLKVLDELTMKCQAREVPVIKIEKKGFYEDRIILSSKHSYKKNKFPEIINGEKIMVEKFGSFLNLMVDDELEVNHYQDMSKVYEEMIRINNLEYNANAFALVFTSLMMEKFEKSYKLHPIIYVHGFRDTGKTSLVEFALSIITTDYNKLEPGITSPYTMLMSMSGKDYIPVLIDEAAKFLTKQDSSVIQILKDIATNGGKHIKGKPGGVDNYVLKATPILVNEFRIDTLDPSFYQRCIEIDLNVYDKINLDVTSDFNELMATDKTSILHEMIKFLESYRVDFKKITQFLKSSVVSTNNLDKIDGKKKFSVTLYSAGLLLAYNFMIEKGLKKKNGELVAFGDMFNHINKYMLSEINNNSANHRVMVLSEQFIQLLEMNVKFKAGLIQSRIAVEVVDDGLIFYTNMRMLTAIGWKNQHLLGEVRMAITRKVGLNGKQFQCTASFPVRVDEGMSFLDNLSMVTDNATVTDRIKSISRKTYKKSYKKDKTLIPDGL